MCPAKRFSRSGREKRHSPRFSPGELSASSQSNSIANSPHACVSSLRGNPNVEILEQDILDVDLASLVAPGTQLTVIGNLPYYLTSDILLRLFSWHALISQAVVMVQREVADRVAATPGSRDYGMLSATAQMYARVDKLFTLPPHAFSPPPEVFSTVLRLTMQPQFSALGVDPGPFQTFLRQSFAQKRKTLANNLRAAGYTPAQIQAAFAVSGTPLQVRAEALTLEAAARLHLALLRQ